MISGIKNTLSSWTSGPQKVSEWVSIPMMNTIKNMNKIAIPAILLFAATNLQYAEAGPLAYASCMAGCAAMPPICAAGGWAACLAALAAPTP